MGSAAKAGACGICRAARLEHITTTAFNKLWGNAGTTMLDTKNEIEKKLKHKLTHPQIAVVKQCIDRLVAAAEAVSSDDDDSSSSSDETSSSSSSSDDDEDEEADGDVTMSST